jgi:hypothetical protein
LKGSAHVRFSIAIFEAPFEGEFGYEHENRGFSNGNEYRFYGISMVIEWIYANSGNSAL